MKLKFFSINMFVVGVLLLSGGLCSCRSRADYVADNCADSFGIWKEGRCQCPLFSEEILGSNGAHTGLCISDLNIGSVKYEADFGGGLATPGNRIDATFRIERDVDWRKIHFKLRDLKLKLTIFSLSPENEAALRGATFSVQSDKWQTLKYQKAGIDFQVDLDRNEFYQNRNIRAFCKLTVQQDSRTWLFTGQIINVSLVPLENAWSSTHLPGGSVSGWKVVGVGDFNGDGILDVAWRRINQTGEVRLWLYRSDGTWEDRGLTTGAPGWSVIATGDFNKDGRADIAWRRTNNTGEVRLWLFRADGGWDDVGIPGSSQGQSGWKVVGVGDFNGDGIIDLAWKRINDNGEVRLWLYGSNGAWRDIGLPQNNAGYKLVGVGDFNKDGRSDLLYQRIADNSELRVQYLDSDGSHHLKFERLPNEDLWNVVGVGDINRDGTPDIFLHRNAQDPIKVKMRRTHPL